MKNPTHLHFRKGTPEDKNACRELGLASYGQYATVLSPDNWETMESNLKKDDTWDNLMAKATYFVCESEGALVGMAFVLPSGNPNHIYEAEWAHLRMVGVHPNHSGRGIAKKLTEMSIDLAKQNKEKILALHTAEFMDAARHIYENLGFKVLRDMGLLFGKKYWIYTLELGNPHLPAK